MTVKVEDGVVQSVTGLAAGGSITYNGKTYKYTATGATFTVTSGDASPFKINGKNYYTAGTTLTVTNFTSGQISFDNTIDNLTAKDNSTITAKKNNETALTLNVAVSHKENSWSTIDTNHSSTYIERTTAGAKISGTSIDYEAGTSTDLFTLSGITSTDGITVNNKSATLTSSNVGTYNLGVVGKVE